MVYRIPSDDEVAKAINNCLAVNPHMHSLRELHESVSRNLGYIDPLFRISPERVRKIGIDKNVLSLEISYAETDREVGSKCPVCGGTLIPVRNTTLEGRIVEMYKNCKRCGFTAKGSESRPARYIITRKTKISTDKRIEMLREAERLLLRAADLMDGALRMSGIGTRSGDNADMIRRIASDKEYGGSLRNLALDLERLETDPLWTRPLDSPKKQFNNSDQTL